jgi:hypothetical protein
MHPLVIVQLMPGFLVALPGRQFSFLENRESVLSKLLAKVLMQSTPCSTQHGTLCGCMQHAARSMR